MTKRPAFLLNFALALLTAVLLVLVFPNLIFPTFGLPWLAPMALTPLLIALAREPRPLWRFLLGEFAGIVYWFGVCYWIQFVLEVHGGMGRWGGWGTFLLFCVAKAIHLGVFSLLAAVVIRTWYAVPAIAALWTGIERTHATFRIRVAGARATRPSIWRLPMRLAPFVGVYGISFVLAHHGVDGGGDHSAPRPPRTRVARRGARAVAVAGPARALRRRPQLPWWCNRTCPKKNNGRPLQPRRFAISWCSVRLMLRDGSSAHLIIWPEVPGPLYYYNDPKFRDEATNLARFTHAYFLFGTVGETAHREPLNSAVMLNPSGDLIDRYDKINLVPFGEYVPKFFGFVNRITQEAGDFVPGNRIVDFSMDDHRLGVFICYESVFPHEVRQFVKQGADLLVNISNDGYFGHSAAREQHLEIARMRAAENRRWLIRATNDGIRRPSIRPAALPSGSPMYQEAVARMNFGYESSTTFYTEHGDWFAWGCWLGVAIALFCSQLPHYTPRKNNGRKKPIRAGSPARRRP